MFKMVKMIIFLKEKKKKKGTQSRESLECFLHAISDILVECLIRKHLSPSFYR